jgi:response regulator RpfG family c-di-GMP phosphodiesterase
MTDDTVDDLYFADEAPDSAVAASTQSPPWKLLIVDDDEAVHQVTRLALSDFEFGGRTLALQHAYSAAEAKVILGQKNDIAVALIDVVMETENAGLELVRHIREELGNRLLRIILRTGQPGQAPEREVIRDYDINDYKEKTELTVDKLFSTILASLRSYRDILALDNNRRGLEQVINHSAKVFRISALSGFASGVLEQLTALLFMDDDAIYASSITSDQTDLSSQLSVIAASGLYADQIGKTIEQAVPAEIGQLIAHVLAGGEQDRDCRHYVSSFRTESGQTSAILVSGINPLNDDDRQLIDLFCRNVSIAHDNLLLREDIDATQRELIYLLSEAVETRSPETGFHVRRVAEYAYAIAWALGLSERDCNLIHRAMPLHDLGKLGIPDAILHKHSKLEVSEWETMKAHPELGYKILKKSERPVLRTAAIIASQHHEKWDGTGYPNGLKGEEIHIFGRIGAVADVFDALGSYRSYKEPWPVENIIQFIAEQRGKQFDPAIADCFLENIEQILAIRDRYQNMEA